MQIHVGGQRVAHYCTSLLNENLAGATCKYYAQQLDVTLPGYVARVIGIGGTFWKHSVHCRCTSLESALVCVLFCRFLEFRLSH